MAAAHFIVPTLPSPRVTTARLGSGNLLANRLNDQDVGKFVKLVGESRYDLTAAGEPIEGVVYSVEPATSGGFAVGAVNDDSDLKLFVTADGLQATPGTGVIAVGDFVVTGSVVARNAAMSGFPKVCKATSQTFISFTWRVVSLGPVGTGAVGTQIVIARV